MYEGEALETVATIPVSGSAAEAVRERLMRAPYGSHPVTRGEAVVGREGCPATIGSSMSGVAATLLTLSLAAPAAGSVVREQKTGVTFPTRQGDMSLLGVGLRTKTFLRFKVYALGLYVADSALAGPLAVHKEDVGSSAFYRDLTTGDFEKELVLKLVRDLSAEQIQGTFRSHMVSADEQLLDQFVSYFSATEAGEECILHWVPGRGLYTTVSGVAKPPIADKAFADDVFSIWLRDRPREDPIRRQLVSRARELLQ
jgi:Chalcone isomerase-like